MNNLIENIKINNLCLDSFKTSQISKDLFETGFKNGIYKISKMMYANLNKLTHVKYIE